MIDRRALLAAGIAAAALPVVARATVPPIFPSRVERLRVGTRTTDMMVWQPARVRGVAILSTGHGAWPERYELLAQVLCLRGLAVLAPLHVDSVRHPDRARFTMQASFGERIADLRAASAHAGGTFPGLPVLAAGHSFGTLSALCLAGGLSDLGDFRDPAVVAVLGFSTPGRVPGLVKPTAYLRVSTPLMLVTGTDDRVPGFVTDPGDHLLPVETVTGPAFGIVVARGRHELVAEVNVALDAARRGIAHVLEPFGLFIDGHALGDRAAQARLARWKPAEPDRFIVRNAA